MATAVETKITNALLARLASLSFTPPIPIGWPNVDFAAPTGRHFRAFVFRNPTDATAFRTETLNGILQVSVYTPIKQGAGPADELAGAVVQHFKRGTWMTSEGVTVRIVRPPYAGSAMRDGQFWMVPVTINWFCQVNA